jgi:hypothetical protein
MAVFASQPNAIKNLNRIATDLCIVSQIAMRYGLFDLFEALT